MSKKSDKKRQVQNLLDAKGPGQLALEQLQNAHTDASGKLLFPPTVQFGDTTLDVVRDLTLTHGFQIETKSLTGGPMPEKVGLPSSPDLIREDDRGPSVIIDPKHSSPLTKF